MSLDKLTDEENNILLMLSYVDLPQDRAIKGKSIKGLWENAKYDLDENTDSYIQIEAYLSAINLTDPSNHN